MACHILLERSWQRLKLCLKPHLNWRFVKEVMNLQSHKSPNFENFSTPKLGVSEQNDVWVLAPWSDKENTIKGKVVASLKFGSWWILWVCVCLRLIHASKVLQLCINQLVIWFVPVYVSNWLACVNHLSAHPRALARFFTLKCYESESMPQLLILPLFSPFVTHSWVHQRSWGCIT